MRYGARSIVTRRTDIPLITFANSTNPTEEEILAVVQGILGIGRPTSLTYDSQLGVIFSVDVPDASQGEADAIQAALIAAFPGQTSGLQNEPHALLCLLDNQSLWALMPAALTELLGNNQRRAGCSMRKVEQVRLVANVLTAGAAGSSLAAQWSTGGAFAFFDVPGAGPSVTVNVAGFRVSPWVNVPTAARADGVALRIVGQGGNAIASPSFGQLLIEGR